MCVVFVCLFGLYVLLLYLILYVDCFYNDDFKCVLLGWVSWDFNGCLLVMLLMCVL